MSCWFCLASSHVPFGQRKVRTPVQVILWGSQLPFFQHGECEGSAIIGVLGRHETHDSALQVGQIRPSDAKNILRTYIILKLSLLTQKNEKKCPSCRAISRQKPRCWLHISSYITSCLLLVTSPAGERTRNYPNFLSSQLKELPVRNFSTGASGAMRFHQIHPIEHMADSFTKWSSEPTQAPCKILGGGS